MVLKIKVKSFLIYILVWCFVKQGVELNNFESISCHKVNSGREIKFQIISLRNEIPSRIYNKLQKLLVTNKNIIIIH